MLMFVYTMHGTCIKDMTHFLLLKVIPVVHRCQFGFLMYASRALLLWLKGLSTGNFGTIGKVCSKRERESASMSV